MNSFVLKGELVSKALLLLVVSKMVGNGRQLLLAQKIFVEVSA